MIRVNPKVLDFPSMEKDTAQYEAIRQHYLFLVLCQCDVSENFWIHDIQSDSLGDLNANLIGLGVQFVEHFEGDAAAITEVATQAQVTEHGEQVAGCRCRCTREDIAEHNWVAQQPSPKQKHSNPNTTGLK